MEIKEINMSRKRDKIKEQYNTLLTGFGVGVIVTAIIGMYIVTPNKKVVELGCASYDSITGVFKLKEVSGGEGL